MAYEHITTYLNDHLAGSVAALELLDSLESAHAKTLRQKFFAELRADVWEDRHELEALMRQLKIDESSTRKASAWFTEKLAELKLRLDDPKDGPMRMLQALEALSLGIEGKRLLWLTLAITSEDTQAFQGVNFERLLRRAEEQRSRVEAERLQAARLALRPERAASAS